MGEFFLPVILVVMIVLLFNSVRKQRAAQRKAQEVRNSMQVGDEVMTGSGFYGVVEELGDETVVLSTEDGALMRWARKAISPSPLALGQNDVPESQDTEADLSGAVVPDDASSIDSVEPRSDSTLDLDKPGTDDDRRS